jgi:transcriptional regulator with XRE-family HTH domain
MDYTTFIKIREHLGLSQQDIADIAKLDVVLVEKYERGELDADEQMTARDKITTTLFKVIAKRYPEKVKAAVQPVLELAKTYPEGSVMRNFLTSAGNFKKYVKS